MNLPNPLDALMKAFNTKDSLLFISCFTKDAEIQDKGENQSPIGHQEIKGWFDESLAKFDFTTEPFYFKESADSYYLKVKVTGNFPGSPLNFLYEIHTNGDQIYKLKISILENQE